MNNRVLAISLAGLLLACSGGGDVIQPVNRPPSVKFSFSKGGFVKNDVATLSVTVSDPDGDPTTIEWKVTRGGLGTPNAATTTWSVPATVGVDTVVVTVRDGSQTTRRTAVLRVCTSAGGATRFFEKSRSPYLLSLNPASPSLLIARGETATIEAGVEILVDTPALLIDVTGRLVSQGTPAQPVIIRPNLLDPQCGSQRGWWEGIQGGTQAGDPPTPGQIELDHTEIWYAQHGVRLRDTASALLRDCAFRCSGTAGVLHEGSGALEVLDTEVSDGRGDGIAIGSKSTTGIPDVRIERCVIKFNGASGLSFNVDDPGNTASIAVEYNVIQSNFQSGITLARAVFPGIHFNHISGNAVGNGLWNIFLADGFPKDVTVTTLNAACNYFGGSFTQEQSIKNTIRDSQKFPALVQTRVEVSPWLNASPLTTTPVCTP